MISEERRIERGQTRALMDAQKAEHKARADRTKAEREYKKAERKAKNGNKASIARADRLREKMQTARETAKQKTRERRAAEKPIKQRQKQAKRERERAEREKASRRGHIFTPKPRTKSKPKDIVFGETTIKELKEELRKLQAKVNARYRDLKWYNETHKDSIESPAVSELDESGGKISAAGNDYVQLYGEYLRARAFLENPLSNMENYKKWLEDIYSQDSDFGEFIDSGLDENADDFEEQRNERIELYYDIFEKLCEMFPPFESDVEGHMILSELINADYDYETIMEKMIEYCQDAYKNDNIYSSHMHEFAD